MTGTNSVGQVSHMDLNILLLWLTFISLNHLQEVTSFVQVSQEMAFSYNPNNPANSRLISMRIGGADVDFERTYNIGMLKYDTRWSFCLQC